MEILKYPDALLHQSADIVTVFDDSLEEIIKDMFATMYLNNGIGLAAPQVGILKQIIVVDIGNNPLYLINPKITYASDRKEETIEGCLSLPDYFDFVTRAKTITVEFDDKTGNKQVISVDGLLSVCIQHEIDHLNGVLFTDRVVR